jgi:hypothetical protein
MFRKPDGAGKGDVPRPIQDREKFESNWDNIFKKKEKNGNKVLPVMPTDEGQRRVQTSSDIKQEP